MTLVENVTASPQNDNPPSVIDVVGDEEQDQEQHDGSTTESFHTPPTGPRPAETQDIPELSERPTGAKATQHSSTPGRDDEEASHMRLLRKKQAITRYERKFIKMRRGEAKNKGDNDDAMKFLSANEDGEGALTYEKVLRGK